MNVFKRYEKYYTPSIYSCTCQSNHKRIHGIQAISYNNSIPHFIQESHERRLKFYYIKLKNMLEYIETNI